MEFGKIKIKNHEFYIVKNKNKIIYIGLENDFKNYFKNIKMKRSTDTFNEIKKQLEEYFLKKRTHFDFQYELIGSDFCLQVWSILKDIPYGTTISYSQLATKLGDVKKTRAVANAVGKNPLLILIPCHRVIAKNRKLGGFRAGLAMKKELLDVEGIKYS